MATEERCQASIHKEILFDTLLWLPTKSLAQLKCVCKEWNSIINSSFFIKKHMEYVNKNLTFGNNHRLILSDWNFRHSIEIIEASDFKVRNLKFPLIDSDYFKFFGSCNGLLFLVPRSGETVLLWNPCNGEYKKLLLTSPLKRIRMGHLYPDSDAFGFGYDQSTDDYKLVRFYLEGKVVGSDGTQCEVYSLKTKSWKKLPDLPSNVVVYSSYTGIPADSLLYWKVGYHNSNNGINIAGFKLVFGILCFDLVDDKFILFPPTSQDFVDNRSSEFDELGKFDGNLCWFQHDYEDNFINILVLNLELNEDGRRYPNWTNLMTLPCSGKTIREGLLTPIFSTKNGQVLLVYSSYSRTRYVFYITNPEEKAFEEFVIEGCRSYSQFVTYTETLVSLNDYVL